MSDEFPCKHRASTEDYREGWDLIWGKKKPEVLGMNVGTGDKSNVSDISAEEIDKIVDTSKATENQCDGCNAGYPIDGEGRHIIPYPSGSMACQKLKYTEILNKLFKLQDGLKSAGAILRLPKEETS